MWEEPAQQNYISKSPFASAKEQDLHFQPDPGKNRKKAAHGEKARKEGVDRKKRDVKEGNR